MNLQHDGSASHMSFKTWNQIRGKPHPVFPNKVWVVFRLRNVVFALEENNGCVHSRSERSGRSLEVLLGGKVLPSGFPRRISEEGSSEKQVSNQSWRVFPPKPAVVQISRTDGLVYIRCNRRGRSLCCI